MITRYHCHITARIDPNAIFYASLCRSDNSINVITHGCAHCTQAGIGSVYRFFLSIRQRPDMMEKRFSNNCPVIIRMLCRTSYMSYVHYRRYRVYRFKDAALKGLMSDKINLGVELSELAERETRRNEISRPRMHIRAESSVTEKRNTP